MTKARVIACKEAGIRRNPAASSYAEDLIGTVPVGEVIQVDATKRVYSWDDKEFYPCSTSAGDGYILTNLVRLMKGGKT